MSDDDEPRISLTSTWKNGGAPSVDLGELRLLDLFAQAPGFMAVLVGREHRFALANPAYQRMVGDRPLLGLTVAEALPGAAEQGYLELCDRVFETGEAFGALGMPFATPSQADDTVENLFIDLELRPIRGADGQVGGVFALGSDVTERVIAQGRRDALIRLSDAFRESSTVGELSFLAGQAVGVNLDASRVGFGTIDPDTDTLFVDRDWTAPGVVTLQGATPLRQFGSYMDDWKLGLTVCIDDVYQDPRTTAGAQALDGLSARSFVGVPVLEGGLVVAVVYVNSARARRWTDEELTFVKEVAERTRISVERARNETALRELNETLEQRVAVALAERKVFSDVVDGSTASVTVLDQNYRILAINRANVSSFERVFGKRPRVGDAYLELLDDMPEHLAQVKGFWSRALGGEEFSVVEMFGDDALDRRFYDVRFSVLRDLDGKIIGASSTSYDVTDRIQAEQLLRDAEDFSRLALGAVGGVGVWTYEVGEDRFRFDEEIAKLYALAPGSGAEGLSRQAFLANVHPDDVPALRQTMSGGLVNAGDLELEYRIVHPDGSIRWVNSRGHTYFDSDGRPIRRTGIGVEVTRQRELEGALRQSQKMEAVGQLTGGIAHDFNNLLQGVTGALELLQRRTAQGRYDAVDRYVLAAQGAARRAATLTQRLLAFSRRQTLDPKATNANRLLADLQDLLKRSVGPTVDIELIGAGGVWPILVDGNQLENAILNLCINARDAMPDGGRITIETANKWLDDRSSRERGLPHGQYVSLCVTDTGTGMSKETISRIFDPFFTTKPLGEGTGLGLSMVYGFARQSGGQVRVYSELGSGATFCLYFPRHYGEAEIADVLPGAVREAPEGGGKTVLVVDDEPTVRLLVAEVLEDGGFRCIESSDGAAALAILQSDVHIDLLITDVGLPGGLNGRQVFDAARVSRPGLRTLFITGYAENAAIGNGLVDRHMGLLTKPFSIAALSSKISDMLAE